MPQLLTQTSSSPKIYLSAWQMDLCASIARKKVTGQEFATLETQEEQETGKETEKTLGCITSSTVKTNTTDEDQQIENMEMGI